MKNLFLILVFCVKNDFAQSSCRVTLRMLATYFRFFLVSINHALFSSVRFNPCRIKLFFLFLFDVFTSLIILFSFHLIYTLYMSECFSDNKNFFKNKHLSLFVTVYSTINVRVNNYCVAFFSRKKSALSDACNLAYDQGKPSLREIKIL